MSGSEDSRTPSQQVPLGLNLEQARELGRGNAIHQLQRNYQTLSQEVSNLSTQLGEVLAHLRGNPIRGRREAPRDASPSSPSSSSHEEFRPRRDRRPPLQPMDDLRDMKFDPPEFEGNLNPDLFIEWTQSLERFFEVKEYSDEKAFKVAVLKLKKYASLWYENLKK